MLPFNDSEASFCCRAETGVPNSNSVVLGLGVVHGSQCRLPQLPCLLEMEALCAGKPSAPCAAGLHWHKPRQPFRFGVSTAQRRLRR